MAWLAGLLRVSWNQSKCHVDDIGRDFFSISIDSVMQVFLFLFFSVLTVLSAMHLGTFTVVFAFKCNM